MAKQTRQKATRPAAKRPGPSAARRRPQTARKTGASPPRTTARAAASGANGPPSAVSSLDERRAVAPPPPPPRKPSYYEALAMYETGVRALQRHDYEGAAAQFRLIIERYPEERELQERSQLYLRVCERETARRPPTPQSPQERVYAATVALNAGDTSTALEHLRRALADSPDSDHAHYIMSVALAARGDSSSALEHLRQAITLNPENRGLARQDPDLEPIRDSDEFRDLVDGPASARNKSRKRR